MVRNPFRYLHYVSPEDFVGRWPLVDSIAQDLIHQDGDSHAIIAGQRCGKSSLLEALAYQLRQPATMEASDSVALPMYIDFKAGAFNSAESVFAFILNRIYRQINTVTRQHPLELWTMPLRLSARWFEKLVVAPELSQHDFEDGLSYILDQLDTPTLPVRMIVMLDEIGKSYDQPWTDALYNQARALICSNELRTRLRMVLTGSQRFLEQRGMYSSQLCDVVKLHYLEAFDQTSTAELIARAPSLPQPAAQAVWRQSGGHPFLAQYLLYHLWEQAGKTGLHNTTPEEINRIGASFLHKRAFEFESWAQAVQMPAESANKSSNKPDGYKLCTYKVLSDVADWVSEDQILAAIDAPPQSIKQSLLGLCCHGLAMHDEDWTHFKYTGDLFRTWFNSYGKPKPAFEQPGQTSASDQVQSQVHIHVNTGGGPYIAGSVNTAGGGFIGRDTMTQPKDIAALLSSELVYG